ncbi:MAG: hypothetical protein H6713_37355 [Myxococcales bacterium]|nr:hypothetical protein [Myxococcales bacterium]MCB9755633.1 hypothetical protein [Myxococcales bacterium]
MLTHAAPADLANAPALPHRYMHQDSPLTLREGIEEMRRANPGLLDPSEMPADIGKFFHAHDVCHVVFGTDTSITNEAMTDTWTVTGTTVRVRDLLAYYKQEEGRAVINDLMREIGWLRTLWASVVAIPKVLRVIWRARRMTRKWPMYGNDAYLDTPLAELRRMYNIRVVH